MEIVQSGTKEAPGVPAWFLENYSHDQNWEEKINHAAVYDTSWIYTPKCLIYAEKCRQTWEVCPRMCDP